MLSINPGQTDKQSRIPATDPVAGSPADGYAENLFAQAVSFQNRGENEKAIECYHEAIRCAPRFAEAFYNIGVLHYQNKDWPAATHCFGKAFDLKPDFVDAAYNMATALMQASLFDQAAAAYQKALQLVPNLSKAYFYQGWCYQKTADVQLAIRSYRQAVSLQPDNALAWFRLAEVLFKIGSIDEALFCFRKAVELKPDWPEAHHNLSIMLRKKGRLEEAIRHTLRALELSPEFPEANEQLLRLAQRACDWQLMRDAAVKLDHQTNSELEKGQKTAESPMVSIRRHPEPTLNLRIARNWSRHIAREVSTIPNRPVFRHNRSLTPARLRIGYLSGDFRDHAVAYQIRGMLAAHNRHHFEIFGYACNADNGTMYRRLLSQACDHFIDIHACSDVEAAQQIHSDGIHILVDMMGYSQDNRIHITAMRPAPVQASYLGFLGTTGAPFIDYIIADPIVIPHEHSIFYSERIAYLPHCYQANDDELPIAAKEYSRKEFHLPADVVVYCCFNQPYKIDARLFAIWLDILKQVDGSVLWLAEQNSLARENLCFAAEKASLNSARLIFTDFMPHDHNLARLKLADLALDTCIYNGGATTSNALWAGVPVLAVLGNHWVSRMSASALKAAGLPELVARNLSEYGRIAVDLGRNPVKLETLRDKLAFQRQKSPLFNTRLFTRHMETAYAAMWQRCRNNQPPATFMVQP
jgi:protein O-GlcNAc transferase